MARFVTDGMRLFMKPKSGVLEQIRADFSEYAHNQNYYQPYSISDESYSTATREGGDPSWGGTWYVCAPGTRIVNGMCLEPMALTLHS